MNSRPKTMRMIIGFGTGFTLNQILEEQTWEVFTGLIHAVDNTMAAWKSDFIHAVFALKNIADFLDTQSLDFRRTVMKLWIEEDGLTSEVINIQKSATAVEEENLSDARYYEIVFTKKTNVCFIEVYSKINPKYVRS